MKILILDNDRECKERIMQSWSVPDTELLDSKGGQNAIKIITQSGLGAVFLSTDFLHIDNLDTLTLIKEHNAGVEIFILSDRKDTAKAEEAIERGAHSFLVRPIQVSLLESLVKKAIARALSKQNHRLLEEHVMVDLLGSTPAMEKILSTIYKVAPTNSSILIEGETGTGKEFVANLIHRISTRSDDPFVAINCGAIPENLMESELFGAKKGAFTGATADRKGLFEEADMGTLFLDEIGEMPLNLQVKLLRFLQDKEIRRVGANESRFVDVRVIAATNQNLSREVANSTFREDLFYRLNIFHLLLPPLRDRRGTIPHLIRFFVKKHSSLNEKHIKGMAKDAESILLNYEYPGNIRELENIIEHAVVMCEGEYIMQSNLPERLGEIGGSAAYLSLPKSNNIEHSSNNLQSLAQLEKNHIVHALQVLKNNQTDAAKKLGISRSTLWRKIKEHNIVI